MFGNMKEMLKQAQNMKSQMKKIKKVVNWVINLKNTKFYIKFIILKIIKDE